MCKNVTLRKRNVQGQATWVLLGPDGLPIPAFSSFAHSLRNNARNTLNSYCRHLAEFLDYLIEVSTLYEGLMTKLQLSEAIEAYGDYLLLGVDADHSIARAAAARLPPGKSSPASLVPKLAAVRRFLRLSEAVRRELEDLERLGLHDRISQPAPLLPELGQRRKLLPSEVCAMKANSMLAGVIAGGPKLVDCVALARGVVEIPYEETREFPYDKVLDLVRAMPTYRDKALYSLLAASGCRTHEALQLLWEDIDVERGTVILVDPRTRIGHASYRSLSKQERARLSWKGRATQLTFLMEPYKAVFFETLQAYLEREYIAHGHNQFVFQYLGGERRGKPYFLSAALTRVEIFHRACERIGVELPAGTAKHSLRHTYGFYVYNYCPNIDGGYGLPLPEVQQVMGHTCVKSTRRYARYDQDLTRLKVQYANRKVYSGEAPKSVAEYQLKVLEAQISEIRGGIVEGDLPYD